MPPLFERFQSDWGRNLAATLQETGDRSSPALRESTPMPFTESPSLVAQEPSSFEVAVRDRSWDWLLELRRRLKVDLVLVDSRGSILVPAGPSDQAARLSSMLEHREAPLLSAISNSLKERVPQVFDFNGLQIASAPLIVDRHACGALLVGRLAPSRKDSNATKTQLELLASWLTAAIDAHLFSPPALPASGLNRVAPLAHLLGDAATRESDRKLIHLFGEAIAVWHDIDVSGYLEMPNSAFARDVTLPGAKRGERPATIAAEGLPDSTELTRLPQGHLDRFGLPVNSDVYVRRFNGTDGRSWLLVFTGAIGVYDVQRICAYAGLLELALSISASTFVSRVVSTISAHLARTGASPETLAADALEELRTALGAAAATLTIESTGGATLLRVVCPNAVDEEGSSRSQFRVALVKRSDRHYTTTVSLGRHDSLQFTPRDHAAASAVVAMLDVWASAAFSTASVRRERRVAPRGFPEVVERSAREALDRGSPIAMVVLIIRDAASFPGSTQRWVADMRGQLRASDLAGMLGEGEIGLLMPDTEAEQAKAIAERLRSVVGDEPGRESILVGIAGRSPRHGTAEGIVHDARADAVAGTRRGRATASPHGVNR
jgi:hypothetical protein